jgi:predicted 3-demethylubiquinone-9 3-methyltransferase (glyoxalase superfamily)
MQKIPPHLWFDKDAKQAVELYTSIFKDSKVISSKTLDNTPSGNVDILSFQLMGQEFKAISAGPLFKFTPAVSFLVACKTKEEVDTLWKEISNGGAELMPLGAYPFSEKYAWIQDRYGLSWQLMFMGDRQFRDNITPTLMFVGDQCGRGQEALDFYTSLFHDTSVDHVMRYEANQQPDKEGTIKHAGFTLEGESFALMDSAHNHNFGFSEAISFMVNCNSQSEVDYYWSKLSANPKSEQCGWLKDKFGVSWQVIPTVLGQLLQGKDLEGSKRAMAAMLQMKKMDIAALERAYCQR